MNTDLTIILKNKLDSQLQNDIDNRPTGIKTVRAIWIFWAKICFNTTMLETGSNSRTCCKWIWVYIQHRTIRFETISLATTCSDSTVTSVIRHGASGIIRSTLNLRLHYLPTTRRIRWKSKWHFSRHTLSIRGWVWSMIWTKNTRKKAVRWSWLSISVDRKSVV